MIMVGRKIFILVCCLALISIAFLGIRGYGLMRIGGDISSDNVKFRSETFLYIAVLLTVLFIAVCAAVIRRSMSITREIDKMIELTRHGNSSVEESLRKLGELGGRVRTLYSQLNELNEKKSLKISAMHQIQTILLNNVNMALLVTDITGRITDVSKKFLEGEGKGRQTMIGKQIQDLLPKLDFQELARTLELNKQAEEKKLDETCLFHPVFNRDGELSDIICNIGKEKLSFETVSQGGDEPGKRTVFTRLLRRTAPLRSRD